MPQVLYTHKYSKVKQTQNWSSQFNPAFLYGLWNVPVFTKHAHTELCREKKGTGQLSALVLLAHQHEEKTDFFLVWKVLVLSKQAKWWAMVLV